MATQRVKAIDDIRSRVGLGRRYTPDVRDRDHLMRGVLRPREAKAVETKTWSLRCGVLDQGATSMCVAYSWTAFLLSSPLQHRVTALGCPLGDFLNGLYSKARTLDEWDGEDYAGTSVRGGAKALTEMGRMAEYLWAFDADVARDYVLTRGPMVMGTNWHVEMYKPDNDGYLKPEGSVDGGHAWLIIGFNKKRDAFRMQNSWGESWGQNGRAWIKRKDLAALIEADGEACSAIEKALPRH